MLVTKPIDLPLLDRELTAAAVPHNGLGLSGTTLETGDEQDLHTFVAGLPAELPPEAVPVVNAHVAPLPVYDYVATREVSSRFTTTDATFKEIYRLTTTPHTIYRATLSMEAVDAVSLDVKDSEARLVFKNTGTVLVQVGAVVPLGTAQDSAASAWRIDAQIQGLDLVIGVRGAAGRTINWTLKGDLVVFAPGGLGS